MYDKVKLRNFKEMLLVEKVYSRSIGFSEWDVARNLVYEWGKSSISDDKFQKELNKLVDRSIIVKIYDFVDNDGYRQGCYQFLNGSSGIDFHGMRNNLTFYFLYE